MPGAQPGQGRVIKYPLPPQGREPLGDLVPGGRQNRQVPGKPASVICSRASATPTSAGSGRSGTGGR
jgi:hypothetical protein